MEEDLESSTLLEAYARRVAEDSRVQTSILALCPRLPNPARLPVGQPAVPSVPAVDSAWAEGAAGAAAVSARGVVRPRGEASPPSLLSAAVASSFNAAHDAVRAQFAQALDLAKEHPSCLARNTVLYLGALRLPPVPGLAPRSASAPGTVAAGPFAGHPHAGAWAGAEAERKGTRAVDLSATAAASTSAVGVGSGQQQGQGPRLSVAEFAEALQGDDVVGDEVSESQAAARQWIAANKPFLSFVIAHGSLTHQHDAATGVAQLLLSATAPAAGASPGPGAGRAAGSRLGAAMGPAERRSSSHASPFAAAAATAGGGAPAPSAAGTAAGAATSPSGGSPFHPMPSRFSPVSASLAAANAAAASGTAYTGQGQRHRQGPAPSKSPAARFWGKFGLQLTAAAAEASTNDRLSSTRRVPSTDSSSAAMVDEAVEETEEKRVIGGAAAGACPGVGGGRCASDAKSAAVSGGGDVEADDVANGNVAPESKDGGLPHSAVLLVPAASQSAASSASARPNLLVLSSPSPAEAALHAFRCRPSLQRPEAGTEAGWAGAAVKGGECEGMPAAHSRDRGLHASAGEGEDSVPVWEVRVAGDVALVDVTFALPAFIVALARNLLETDPAAVLAAADAEAGMAAAGTSISCVSGAAPAVPAATVTSPDPVFAAALAAVAALALPRATLLRVFAAWLATHLWDDADAAEMGLGGWCLSDAAGDDTYDGRLFAGMGGGADDVGGGDDFVGASRVSGMDDSPHSLLPPCDLRAAKRDAARLSAAVQLVFGFSPVSRFAPHAANAGVGAQAGAESAAMADVGGNAGVVRGGSGRRGGGERRVFGLLSRELLRDCRIAVRDGESDVAAPDDAARATPHALASAASAVAAAAAAAPVSVEGMGLRAGQHRAVLQVNKSVWAWDDVAASIDGAAFSQQPGGSAMGVDVGVDVDASPSAGDQNSALAPRRTALTAEAALAVRSRWRSDVRYHLVDTDKQRGVQQMSVVTMLAGLKLGGGTDVVNHRLS